jgi:two-component system, OmpR family, phosphate regulon sensor histidine kinase PhoR
MKLTTDVMQDVELDTKLDEAEDVRRAIIRGEVDAFVVGDDNNRRVLLLANAYQRYRQVVERMTQGAITVNERGNILYANQRLAEMLNLPLPRLYTAPIDTLVELGDRARLASFLLVSSRDSSIEVNMVRSDRSLLPVRLSLATLTDGYSTLLVTDLRPMQWPSLTVDALDSIRDTVESLNQRLAGDAEARGALASISEQINGLARMIDEMLDVENPGTKKSSSA